MKRNSLDVTIDRCYGEIATSRLKPVLKITGKILHRPTSEFTSTNENPTTSSAR